MVVVVTSSVVDGLVAEADARHPHEACGLLFGQVDYISDWRPAANIHPEPRTHFEIDPQALIDAHRAARKGGPRLVGYYHSHPAGPAQPSATDRAMAAGDGMIWVIVGAGAVRLWRATPAGFSALSYSVI